MRIKRLAINGLAVICLMMMFVVLIKLGLWQLARAEVKVVQIETRQHTLSTLSDKLPKSTEAHQHNAQLIRLNGHLDFSKTMLLDNKVVNGIVGYEVLVPFYLLEGSVATKEASILINLGWIAGTGRRDQLPHLTQWPDIKELTGYLHIPSHNPFVDTVINVDEGIKNIRYPLVIPAVDFYQMTSKLNQVYYPGVIRLHEESDWGYNKQWQWNNKMTPDKHRGYAMQWFALAVTLLLLSSYFIWQLNRPTLLNETN